MYLQTLLDSLLLLGEEITVFWIVVSVLSVLYFEDLSIFRTSYVPPQNPEDSARERTWKVDRSDYEEGVIVKDLLTEVVIPNLDTSAHPIQLLQRGVALNQTLSQLDADREARGDHWLSYYRWLWLAFEQFVLGAVLLVPFSLVPNNNLVIATMAFVISTCIVLFFGALNVPTRSRLAVQRFEEHVSFLHSGFQMIVPIIEQYELVPLAKMVWGPGKDPSEDEDDTGEFHISGAIGSKSNPEPGIFFVTLRGKYKMRVTVKIVVQVRREHPVHWFQYVYEFGGRHEIGEIIADTAQAILTNSIREVEENQPNANDPAAPKKPIQSVMEDRLMNFINKTPEITGAILLALYELSRERLGGLLVVSVAITNVEPSKAFRQQLVKLDAAQVDREASKIDGEGTAERWEKIVQMVSSLCAQHDKDVVFGSLDRDARLEVARKENSADQLVASLLIPWIEKLGRQPEKPKK